MPNQNAAAVIAGGRVVGVYHKELLPNYGVFDEARYFAESREPTKLWEICGVAAGVSICEDIWSPEGPPARQAAAGATLLLNINGSPFHQRKSDARAKLLSAEAKRSGAAVVYVNCVGGQDELVFDGHAAVHGPDGRLVAGAMTGTSIDGIDAARVKILSYAVGGAFAAMAGLATTAIAGRSSARARTVPASIWKVWP